MPPNDGTQNKTIKLKILNPQSFCFWRSAVTTMFQVHDVMNIVLGQEPRPMPANGNPNVAQHTAIAKWDRRHGQAVEALLNYLEDTELARVHDLTLANEIWNHLTQEFGARSQLKFA